MGFFSFPIEVLRQQHKKILVFKLPPCSECCYALFWVIPRRLNFTCRRFGTECSETSAYKIPTPGNYPEESIQHKNSRDEFLQNTSAFSAHSTQYFPYTEEVSLNTQTNKDYRNDVNPALVEESGLGAWTGKK